MERMLQKMARQLRGFDEASLMELWEHYSRKVSRFEPSREWEEAVLILAMIQGMRWKNQLFNHHWSESLKTAPQPGSEGQLPVFSLHDQPKESLQTRPAAAGSSDPAETVRQERGKVLSFRPVKND